MSLKSDKVDLLQLEDQQTDLYVQYGQAIFAYLRLHVSSLEDAEDLLLEVFLAALEHNNLVTFAPGKQLAWLRRVAHNKYVNLYRHTYRHLHVPLDAVVETIFTEEGPEQSTLRQEERLQLQQHLQKLSTLQQQTLQLRYGDGLSCSEIALLLNKREAAIRKLLSRSINSLRQIYQHN